MTLNIINELKAAWAKLSVDVQDALVEMGWEEGPSGQPVLTGADGKPKSANPADHLRWLNAHAEQAEASVAKTATTQASAQSQAAGTAAAAALSPASVQPDNVQSASIHEANNATTGTAKPALDNLNEPAKV